MEQDRSGALSGERRVVTAMFCDVVGSTSLAENMDPEDWGDLVGQAIEVMGSVVERFGGTVAEFGGDAVLAIFGAPTAHEDDPYRAVRAASTIISEVESSANEAGLRVRVGLCTGLAVVGDIKAGALNTFSALGDTLNVAARLQALAEPGSIVISSVTRQLLGSDIEVTDLGEAQLKGRSAPVEVHKVLSIKGVDDRRRGVPGLSSPMVGRSAELEALQAMAGAAAVGTGRVGIVVGEPGVGKSRLLEELHSTLAAEEAAGDVRWVLGRCAPFDEDLPYHLLTSLVRSLAEVDASAAADVLRKAVAELTDRFEVGQHTQLLQRLVGVPGAYEEIAADALVASYGDALRDVLAAHAQTGTTLVIVCEDVHWADASSVEVMSRIVAAVPSLPILLLLAMRPDREVPGWTLVESARRELGESLVEVALRPLSDRQSRELLANLLEIESLPPDLRASVAERAEGNPFFLEEVVRALVDRGLVDRVDGRWVAHGPTLELEVPDTIQGLLASRIDRLEPEARRAGRVAAVIGRQFTVRLFSQVYGTPEPRGLHPHLAALESAGLIRLEETVPEPRFGFRHALVHDVFYEGLLRKERRELHRAVADAITHDATVSADELPGILARHYERAGDGDKARASLFQAGQQALDRGARSEAVRFFGKLRRLLESDPNASPRDRVDAVIGELMSGVTLIPANERLQAIQTVLPLAKQMDDPERLATLYAWDALVRGMADAEDPDYTDKLDAAYALLPRLRSRAVTGLLHAARGAARRAADDLPGSVGPLQRAIDDLESVGSLAAASFNASMLADGLATMGRFDESKAAVERAMDLAERSQDPNAVLDADIISGRIAAERGDLTTAKLFTVRGLTAAESIGNTYCTMAGAFTLAEIQLRMGEAEEAIPNLQKTTGLAQYCNAVGYELLGEAWLASARAHTGELHREDFDRPLAKARQLGTRRGEGLVLLQRAIATARHGHYDLAAQDFEDAVTRLRDFGAMPLLARAELAYADMLASQGKQAQAQEHRAQAERVFADLGIRPDVR